MKHFLLIAFCLVGIGCYAQYLPVPASPYPVVITQPDGLKLTIYAGGDEWMHFPQTEDGYTLIKNTQGYYEYAQIDERGELIPSGYKARNPEERRTNEKVFLSTLPRRITPLVSVPDEEPLKSSGMLKAFPSQGQQKLLMVLIKYPDLNSTYSSGSFYNLMNQSDYGGTGSFRDYYYVCSGHKLELAIDVVGWYTAEHSYVYYGEDEGDNRARELVGEAIDAAEAAGVNFSVYDNDNDGTVDNLLVVHSGPGAEEGSRTEYIWSHSWSLGYMYDRYYDGVRINSYLIQPETRSYGMVGIGVFCHEFGHALGLPDLYDTDGSSEGLGEWCLMASGLWLNQEKTPAMMSAWCREELNWVSPTVIPWPVTDAFYGDYALNPSATSTEVYKIVTQNSNEYFLLENMYRTGFNAYLPGSGMAIFHVNTDRSDNDNEDLKLVDMEEADGKNDLDNIGNRGDAGDIFPGSSHNTLFNDLSSPDAQTYDGKYTGISVSDIRMDGSTARFTLSSADAPDPLPNLTYDPAMNHFVVDGTYVEIGLQVRNTGDTDAGVFRIGYYLSLNQTITTTDHLVGSDYVSGLAQGASINHTLNLDVSTLTDLPDGNYYLGFIIDYQNIVEEKSEADNSAVYTGEQVVYEATPNLTFVDAYNTLSVTGDVIEISLRVQNNGNSTADACRVGYFLSSDPFITPADYLMDYDFVGVLHPGETSNESTVIDVAQALPDLPGGTYSIGYMIDYRNGIPEEDENDNAYAFDLPKYTREQESTTWISEEICQGDSVFFNGDFLTQSGIYETVLTNQYGFDSIVTLDLTVLPMSDTLICASVCEGTCFGMQGTFYCTAGIYTDTLVNRYGCDSVVTLDLTVHPATHTFLMETICEGDSLVTAHAVYKTEGVYTEHLVSQFGCDSVVELELTVIPLFDTTLYVELCEGEEYRVGDSIWDEEGTYQATLTNRYGCDSLVTVHLTMLPVSDTLIEAEICAGETYWVGDSEFTDSGEYTEILQNRNGCDSVVTLLLGVRPVSDTLLEAEICEGDSVVVGGSVYRTNGIYTVGLENRYGCDSVVTLNLTVHPEYEQWVSETLCEGDSIVIGGVSYQETGIYENHLTTRYGCDSLVVLDLTIHPVDDTLLTREICNGEEYAMGEYVFHEEGTYQVSLSNRFGCDSLVTLILNILPVDDTLLEAEICSGESFRVGNSEFTEAGTYTEILQNQYGCDSMVTLILQVLPVSDTLLEAEICEGDSVVVGGSVYRTSGVYTDVLVNRYGCDSLVTLNLAVYPVYDILIEETLCEGDSVVVGGTGFKETGIYENHLTSRYGCDSLVTLNLTVSPEHDTTVNLELCKGETYQLGNEELTWPGTYSSVLKNRYGCDSMVTVNLAYKPVTYASTTRTICSDDSLVVGSSVYRTSGTYRDTLLNRFSCDSIITTYLTVCPVSDTVLHVELCEGESYAIGTSNYYTSGTYSHTLTNQWGCDSMVTLHLEIHPRSYTEVTDTLCEGEVYLFGGEVYTASGVYSQVFTNRYGCDSVVTLNLTVHPVYDILLEETICEGDSVVVGDMGYKETGIYENFLTSQYGCDSLVILDLLVHPVYDTVLTVTICKGDSVVVGSSVYDTTGIYTEVLMNRYGCDSVVTLDLTVKDTVQVVVPEYDRTAEGIELDIYPNPARTFVNIEISGATGGYRLRIVSTEGKTMYVVQGEIFDGWHMERIGLHRFSHGYYSVVVESGGKRAVRHLVVK